MSDKEEALQEIASLARRHGIAAAEILQILAAGPDAPGRQSPGILSRLFGYLGGVLVFSGICVFVSMYWDDMGSAARVVITLGSGFALFLMALISLGDARYQKAATPLFLMSALLQPAGILVMLKEYGSGGDPRQAILYAALIMLVQQGAAFWARQRSVLAFTATFFGAVFFAQLFDLWGVSHNLTGTVIGASLLCIAYAASHSRHAAIAPFWYFVGAVLLLAAVFDAVRHTAFELAYLGLTAFLIFLSTYARSRALLLVSTLAMLWYIGWFTAEHFAHTLGWPLALIIGGLALIGLGAGAVRLNNKYIKQQ